MGKLGFVGFENYARFLEDKNFIGALSNTLKFVIITAPALVVVALVFSFIS